MIVGIGVDAVEVGRFVEWQTYSHKKLTRIFSPKEIEYCLHSSVKSAERFAARFAAREAFYKAWCAVFPSKKVSFLTICRSIKVDKSDNGRPLIIIEGLYLFGDDAQCYNVHLSLSHTQSLATAFVIIEKV